MRLHNNDKVCSISLSMANWPHLGLSMLVLGQFVINPEVAWTAQVWGGTLAGVQALSSNCWWSGQEVLLTYFNIPGLPVMSPDSQSMEGMPCVFPKKHYKLMVAFVYSVPLVLSRIYARGSQISLTWVECLVCG